jgi:hypothetical protein
MQGLEVGLAPMAALQSIAVINGRPALWGDGALAVVRASGLMESIKEWTEDTTAYCEARRKGEPEPIRRSFSDADAKAAGLTNKKGPWQDYRPRMRQMRARSWVLRDGFADVLKGLHIAEEAQDIPMRDITPVAHQVTHISSFQGKRDSSAEGKRNKGDVKKFNELRDQLENPAGAIDCQKAWDDMVGFGSSPPSKPNTDVCSCTASQRMSERTSTRMNSTTGARRLRHFWR